jgi:CRP-like cAMP-binding protein
LDTFTPGSDVLLADALQALPFFSGLDPSDIELLSSRFQIEEQSSGHVFFLQEEHADRLYLIVSGKVGIRYKPYDGDQLPVADIGPGGVFGWSSALGRRTYTSSAVCLEDCVVLSIRGAVLRRLCETHPETGVVLLERLAEVIAERLRNTHDHVVEMLRQGIRPPGRG